MTQTGHHRPQIAVSACLLGHQVRFDGGHKRDRFVAENLARVCDLIPICPEVLSGMDTPRATIQLRETPKGVRLVQSNDPRIDYTERMQAVAQQQAERLDGKISGLVVQRKSPSCGLERVPVARGEGKPAVRVGVGMFVQHFARRCPLVPIEEEGRLNDPILRENFLERVYALDRWNRLDPDQVKGFIDFHASHKLNLMARGSDAYRELGRIVSGVTRSTLPERRAEYIPLFMQVLSRRVSRGRHFNVMQHVMGYFKRALSPQDKAELLDVFEAYRREETPLSTPVVLIKHHLRNHPNVYLSGQHYLHPYPDNLALRAQV